jgi:hypothetical protein
MSKRTLRSSPERTVMGREARHLGMDSANPFIFIGETYSNPGGGFADALAA